MMERKDDVVLKMRQGVEGAAKRKGVNVVRGEGRVEDGAVVVDGERYPSTTSSCASAPSPRGFRASTWTTRRS